MPPDGDRAFLRDDRLQPLLSHVDEDVDVESGALRPAPLSTAANAKTDKSSTAGVVVSGNDSEPVEERLSRISSAAMRQRQQQEAAEAEAEEKQQQQGPSRLVVAAMALSTFTACSMYAIMFPTMAPFLETMQDGSEAARNLHLGLCVSAYSAAKVVGAPVVGMLTSRHGIYKPTIWLLIPFFVGNLLYAVANKWWEVLIARFIVGLSATVSTVGRAWVSTWHGKRPRIDPQTPPATRSQAGWNPNSQPPPPNLRYHESPRTRADRPSWSDG